MNTGDFRSAEIDRELEQLVDVRPSPDYQARIRLRVAHEASPGQWPGWLVVAGGAAIVIVTLLVSALPPRGSNTTSTAQIESRITVSPVSSLLEARGHEFPLVQTDSQRHSRRSAANGSVVTAQEDSVAVRKLLAAVESGRWRLLDRSVDEEMSADIAEIHVPRLSGLSPLNIEPIAELPQLDGGRP